MKLIDYTHKMGISYKTACLTAISYSFCAKLYGQRRAKRKTEKIVQELEAEHAVS